MNHSESVVSNNWLSAKYTDADRQTTVHMSLTCNKHWWAKKYYPYHKQNLSILEQCPVGWHIQHSYGKHYMLMWWPQIVTLCGSHVCEPRTSEISTLLIMLQSEMCTKMKTKWTIVCVTNYPESVIIESFIVHA